MVASRQGEGNLSAFTKRILCFSTFFLLTVADIASNSQAMPPSEMTNPFYRPAIGEIAGEGAILWVAGQTISLQGQSQARYNMGLGSAAIMDAAESGYAANSLQLVNGADPRLLVISDKANLVDGKLAVGELPVQATMSLLPTANEASRLQMLTSSVLGNIVKQLDTGAFYVLKKTGAASNANDWDALTVPVSVQGIGGLSEYMQGFLAANNSFAARTSLQVKNISDVVDTNHAAVLGNLRIGGASQYFQIAPVGLPAPFTVNAPYVATAGTHYLAITTQSDGSVPIGSISGLNSALSAKADVVNGKIPISQIPDSALGVATIIEVQNEVQRFSLSNSAARGVIVKELDTDISYMLRQNGIPSTQTDWVRVGDSDQLKTMWLYQVTRDVTRIDGMVSNATSLASDALDTAEDAKERADTASSYIGAFEITVQQANSRSISAEGLASNALQAANTAEALAQQALILAAENPSSGGSGDAALTVANTALTTAGNAVTTANAATSAATLAKNTADAAALAAAAAVNTANTAQTAAASVDTKATNALNASTAAQSQSSANTTSISSLTTSLASTTSIANAANAAAASAVAQSGSANSTAANALTAATTAQSVASTAQQAASAAQTKADEALAAVNLQQKIQIGNQNDTSTVASSATLVTFPVISGKVYHFQCMFQASNMSANFDAVTLSVGSAFDRNIGFTRTQSPNGQYLVVAHGSFRSAASQNALIAVKNSVAGGSSTMVIYAKPILIYYEV